MGGTGSGRWRWHNAKATVEVYAAIDIDALTRAGLFDHKTGLIEWESPGRANGAKNSFRYEIEHSDVPTCRYMNLLRSNSRGELNGEWVVLVSRPQPLGGVRWYFFCPWSCHRQVRKLHLGPVVKRFACRRCQNLTYTSAQAHDRYTAGFQRDPRLLHAATQADVRSLFKAAKFSIARERRWWSKASALSLTITGIPQAEAAGNPRQ